MKCLNKTITTLVRNYLQTTIQRYYIQIILRINIYIKCKLDNFNISVM